MKPLKRKPGLVAPLHDPANTGMPKAASLIFSFVLQWPLFNGPTVQTADKACLAQVLLSRCLQE
jgi:hypothetical protein